MRFSSVQTSRADDCHGVTLVVTMENSLKPLPPYEIACQKGASLGSISRQLHEEVKNGPFRILSETALEEITRLVDKALDAAYDLGFADGAKG